jgi:hypothetical protein
MMEMCNCVLGDKMTDKLQGLRRPRLLIRAARFGLTTYRRDRDLLRLIPGGPVPSPNRAVEILLDQEADAEANRTSHYATYKVAEHVGLLTALMAEAQLASAAQQDTDAPETKSECGQILPGNVVRFVPAQPGQDIVSGNSDLRRAT